MASRWSCGFAPMEPSGFPWAFDSGARRRLETRAGFGMDERGLPPPAVSPEICALGCLISLERIARAPSGRWIVYRVLDQQESLLEWSAAPSLWASSVWGEHGSLTGGVKGLVVRYGAMYVATNRLTMRVKAYGKCHTLENNLSVVATLSPGECPNA
jgi:hypothetical protein